MSTLRNEVIKLSTYRDTAKAMIASLMDRAITQGDSSKIIVIDPSLVNILKYGLITTDSFKKERGVVGIFELNDTVELLPAKNIIYLVRPTLENLRLLNDHILQFRGKFPSATVFLHFCPRTVMAQHVLSTEYQLSRKIPAQSLVIEELDIDFFPLDDDLLSMEYAADFSELYLHGDTTLLLSVAKAVVNMQVARFGPIPIIKGKGKHASRIVKIIERLQVEVGQEAVLEKPAEVEALYIVDRGVDLLTPFMTQLTYEGLVDELYKITAGHFDPPFDVYAESNADPVENRDRMIPLCTDDAIFSEIRDKNFTAVGGVLKQRSLEVKQNYERRKEVQHLKEIKEFMKGLPEMQERHRLVGVHTNIATEIGKTTQGPTFRARVEMEQNIVRQEEERKVLEYIEDRIHRGDDVRRVLRLLSLFSLANGGLKSKAYDQVKEALLLSYGIPQMIAALANFERAGLIVRQEQRSNFSAMRKSFRLWVDDLNEKQPNDAAFAYSGYCPMLTRVVESMVSPALASSTGDAYENAAFPKAATTKDVEVVGSSRVTVIVIVGGITRAELSTLRFMSKQLMSMTGEQRNFVFATTSIIDGHSLVESLLPFNPS